MLANKFADVAPNSALGNIYQVSYYTTEDDPPAKSKSCGSALVKEERLDPASPPSASQQLSSQSSHPPSQYFLQTHPRHFAAQALPEHSVFSLHLIAPFFSVVVWATSILLRTTASCGKEIYSTATGYGKTQPFLFVLSLSAATFTWLPLFCIYSEGSFFV